MLSIFKHYINILLLLLSLFFYNCQLKEPTKNHGILFLKNRADRLVINKTNQNDIIKLVGYPHTKSITNENQWIYFERVLTKGEFLKLGQNVLKENNILILNFDKYGVLIEKKFLDKSSKQKVKFSEKVTDNEIASKSFVEKFLNSLKTKMYGNR